MDTKKRVKVLAYGGLAAGGGAFLLRSRTGRRLLAGLVVGDGHAVGETTDRWHAVTVNRSPEEVAPDGRLPDPLAELGDEIEVRIQPAPGDRGTEIHARPRGSVPSGSDLCRALRKALRETQWLLETGEVLRPDPEPTTKPSPGGRLLGKVTSRSWEEGRL
jgi:hypothetical protein